MTTYEHGPGCTLGADGPCEDCRRQYGPRLGRLDAQLVGATYPDGRPAFPQLVMPTYRVEVSDEGEGLITFDVRHADDSAARAWASALLAQLPASITLHVYRAGDYGTPLVAAEGRLR